MWILNTCAFQSTSENETLIWYFKKDNFENLTVIDKLEQASPPLIKVVVVVVVVVEGWSGSNYEMERAN